MAIKDTHALKRRIIETTVIGPSLANQLLVQFDNLDPERIALTVSLIDSAEKAREDFGITAKSYLEAVAAIENSLLSKAQIAASAIMAEFEDELQRMKL